MSTIGNGKRPGAEKSQNGEKHEADVQNTGGAAGEDEMPTIGNGKRPGAEKPGTKKRRGAHVLENERTRPETDEAAGDPEKRGKSEGGKSATGEKSEADF